MRATRTKQVIYYCWQDWRQTKIQSREGADVRMKVVVLAGGTSAERDVSLSSGSMIYKAWKNNGHQASLLDV